MAAVREPAFAWRPPEAAALTDGVLRELEPVATSPAAYGFAILLGLLWGSFANVCIYRMPPTDEHPHGRSVATPGSHCSACKTPIRWYDNVPLLSWLWLRGKCRSCGVEFSARYLVVEALTGALFGVAWWNAMVANALFEPFETRLIRFAITAAFCFVMVVIAFIDLDTKLILHKVTVPSIVVFYVAGLALPGHVWWGGLVGIVVGYGLPWLIGELYFRITKREGLGLGDGMLLALVGALMGWQGVLVALFGGSVVGSVIGVTALVAARAQHAPDRDAIAHLADDAVHALGADAPSLMRAELPFGPFLAIAATFYVFAESWLHLSFRIPGG